MEFKVTVNGARNALQEQTCINDACHDGVIDIVCEPGNNESLTKEVYTCRECHTVWAAELFPAKVEYICPLGEGPGLFSYTNSNIETGVFNQISTPRGPIADALNEFLRAMKLGSSIKKGEALGKLAFLARVKL